MARRTPHLYIGYKMKSALLLLPNLIGDHRHHELFLPASVDKAVASIDGLIAESETAGRRYLGRFQMAKPANEIPISVYRETSSDEEIDFFLEPLLRGERWGLVSDAGLPCVADPGARLVRRARQLSIPVQAFVGPSAIMLGLMLSGLSAQRFNFHGYLEKDPEKRNKQIRDLEVIARKDKATQIFIEAPYRNKHLLESLINKLADETWLCVAWELTTPNQGVVCQPVSLWKKGTPPTIEKKNAVFMFSSF